MLSGQILRLANSAIFGRLRPGVLRPSRRRHGRNSAPCGSSPWGRPFRICFRAPRWRNNFSIRRFNVHSVATATLLELIAEEVPFESGAGRIPRGLAARYRQAADRREFAAAVRRYPGAHRRERRHADRSRARRHRDRSRRTVRLGDFPLGTFRSDPIGGLPITISLLRVLCKARIEPGSPSRRRLRQSLGNVGAGASAACQKAETLEIPGFAFSQERVLQRFGQEIQKLGDLFR